jgi:hypothetical protein
MITINRFFTNKKIFFSNNVHDTKRKRAEDFAQSSWSSHHLFHPKFKERETPKLNSERKDNLSASL